MYRQRQLDRLERRTEAYLAKAEKLKKFILSDDCSEEAEDIREWLEKFCIGVGLDICCGYFPVADDAIGVDSDTSLVGIDWHLRGDELTPVRGNELDYIVTNYFDVFPNPIAALQEWHRAVREGGCLAFTCANADEYKGHSGALANPRRTMTYTEQPIRHLLERTGWGDIVVVARNKNLLLSAYKRKSLPSPSR